MTVMILILTLAGCQGSDTATEPAPADTEAAVEAVEAVEAAVADGGTLYLCGCEGECGCATAAAEGGTCSCGKELVAHNIIKVEDGVAHLCGCPGGCACGAVNETDSTKCGCGKDLVTVDLAGAGLL
jgi:hypothetical protein